jgi:RNA polymerase sigma factor (sigma-70 family)
MPFAPLRRSSGPESAPAQRRTAPGSRPHRPRFRPEREVLEERLVLSTRAEGPPLGYDLDLGQFEDEQLVVLVQECGSGPARSELLRRYYGVVNGARRRAHCAGLQDADRQDVLQEAVFWVMEAIGRYRTEEHFKGNGCPFRNFVYRVLAARLIDWFRQQNRRQRHFVLRSPLALNVAPGRVGDDRAGGSGGSSPLLGAEWGELMTCLREALAGLGQPAQELWELLREGKSLREIAAELHLSYGVVRRRRRTLFAALRAAVGTV